MLLGGAAFAFAFVQRPGLATTDTKINLQLDPGRYLADVASMWTSTGQLGDVQSGQQTGYLFPMGPFFAVGHALGLSAWVVQRLWLGAVLALATWGVVRLLDALLRRPRGIAHLTAGAVFLLNPFVVTYSNRTTVTLLAYAALPWLMLAVHEGLREDRGWRWPAAFALLVAASGPGVNAGVTAWVLLGPLLLALYEPLLGDVRWRQVGGFTARAVGLSLLVSLWWIVPEYVQSSYGIDFLHFTEQPGTIWGTTSVTESLRLMGFWLSYTGLGFAGRAIPYLDDSRTLLFSTPVVLATLLLPAIALTGFVWGRRWRYGPLFLALALVGVLVMVAGFPDGTPLRHGLYFLYGHVAAVQFLRTSYKAAPVLALALACLAGVAVAEGWRRLGGVRGVAAWRGGAVLAGTAVLAAAAWPLVTGRAQDAQVSFKQVPAAWREAASNLDRQLPPNSRAIVLPGDLFSFYTWGGTVDPILPALSTRPVAERAEVPYGDLRATDLLFTIDGLVHQQRLLPGQLPPLLSLIGVREVVTGTDDDLARSDAPAPADAATQLKSQPGFATPARSYGPVRSFAPTHLGPAVKLPEVRRYDLPSSRGLVRVAPLASPIVVDGSAGGLAELAAFGGLPAHRPLLYAGDLTAAQLRGAVTAGGEVLITDSNRRQAFVAGSLDQNTGPVLTPEQNVSSDGLILDPFDRGPNYETVADYTGVRSVEAPASPQRVQFPEHAPLAAIDGSPQTAWLADPTLAPSQRWLQVDFERPLNVPYVDLLPYGDAGGAVRQVQIAGRTFAVHPGWNRLSLDVRGVTSLRVMLTNVSPPAAGAEAGAGGIRELRIPGVRAGEQLRLPIDAAQALRGRNPDRITLSYLFGRTTGDDPYRRDLAHGPWSALNVHDAGDAEQTMSREFELPAARSFTASAWVNVFAQAPDDALDRLVGYRGSVQATSSSRFDGQPEWRASSALDGDPRTAWIGDYTSGQPAWLQWRTSRPLTVSVLRLRAPALSVRRPTEVQVLWPGGSTPPLPVSPAGVVALPHPVRARTLRLDVLRAVAPPGASTADQRAVGIAEVVGGPRMPEPHARTFVAPCGSARVEIGGAALALRISGSAAAFEQGNPMFARSCGGPVALRAGTEHLAAVPGLFAVDELRLISPAPDPPATHTLDGGRVLDSGTSGRGSYDHIRVSVTGPAWLVLGEGYNRGWEAWCNGRSLGAPVPIDGYANGWRVGPGCRQVRFAFGPNSLAAIGYVISAAAGVVCLLLLVGISRWRRRRVQARPAESAMPVIPVVDAERRWAPTRALAAAVLGGAVFAFVFGLAAGAVSVPVIALVLWGGTGSRTLTLSAGALLAVAVPILYLVHPGDEHGGNHATYAMTHLGAHYVGVAAVGLLFGALWRTLGRARASARGAG